MTSTLHRSKSETLVASRDPRYLTVDHPRTQLRVYKADVSRPFKRLRSAIPPDPIAHQVVVAGVNEDAHAAVE